MRYEDNSVLIGAVRALILLLRIRWAVIIWGNSKGIFNNKKSSSNIFCILFLFIARPNPGTDTGQVRPILFCFVFDGSANDRTTHRTNERTKGEIMWRVIPILIPLLLLWSKWKSIDRQYCQLLAYYFTVLLQAIHLLYLSLSLNLFILLTIKRGSLKCDWVKGENVLIKTTPNWFLVLKI